MVLSKASSPFGSRSRTRILLALHLLGYSYPRALARLLATPIFAVRKALAGLERDGLVSSRLVGRTRVYSLASSYPAREELRTFLQRLAELDTDVPHRIASSTEAALTGLPLPAASTPGGADFGDAFPHPATHRDGWRNW